MFLLDRRQWESGAESVEKEHLSILPSVLDNTLTLVPAISEQMIVNMKILIEWIISYHDKMAAFSELPQ